MDALGDRFAYIATVLSGDVLAFFDPYQPLTDAPPHVRRALVRALAGFFEAFVNISRETAWYAHKNGAHVYPPGFVKEIEKFPPRSAAGEKRRDWKDVPKNLQIALHLNNETHGTAWQPDYTRLGWTAVCAVVKLRNRISHPHSVSELDVSDFEIGVVHLAMWWGLVHLRPHFRKPTYPIPAVVDHWLCAPASAMGDYRPT